MPLGLASRDTLTTPADRAQTTNQWYLTTRSESVTRHQCHQGTEATATSDNPAHRVNRNCESCRLKAGFCESLRTRSSGSVVLLRRTLCVCYISTMGAEPGDIIYGHILGRDNVWHRLAEEEQPQITAPPETAPVPIQRVDPVHVQQVDPVPQVSKPTPGPSYWVRYKRRWSFTAWMVGLVSGLAVTMVQTWGEPNFGVALPTFIMASITAGLVFGSLVNLLAALHPGAPEESPPPAGPRGAPRPVATSVLANGKPVAILVCPDCDATVASKDWALHPRYCVGRAKSLSQLIFNE